MAGAARVCANEIDEFALAAIALNAEANSYAIAIESGAHFEGSVQRQDDPLSSGGAKKAVPAAGSSKAEG